MIAQICRVTAVIILIAMLTEFCCSMGVNHADDGARYWYMTER
jgi:hypothetical protein